MRRGAIYPPHISADFSEIAARVATVVILPMRRNTLAVWRLRYCNMLVQAQTDPLYKGQFCCTQYA